MDISNHFDSRRKGRVWIQRNWPDHCFLNLLSNGAEWTAHSKRKDELLRWAKDRPDVYWDSTARRWWFKSKAAAMEFKLKFGGKI